MDWMMALQQQIDLINKLAVTASKKLSNLIKIQRFTCLFQAAKFKLIGL